MDNAITSGRMFPSYTTAQLEAALAKFEAGEPVFSPAETFQKIRIELDRRKSGASAPGV